MLQWVMVRAVIENPVTHEKYYPRVVSASAQYAYPFTVPTGTVEVVANRAAGTSGYNSPIRMDFIIRVQVSSKFNPREKTVWEDIFIGRIEELSSSYGTKNTLELQCNGLIYEAVTFMLPSLSWGSGGSCAGIISYVTGNYLERISNSDSSYRDSTPTVSYYDVKQNQKSVGGVIRDMEQATGYAYTGYAVATFTSADTLSTVHMAWKAIAGPLTDKYKIIEGTTRFISASFTYDAAGVVNYCKVYGDTVTTTTHGPTDPDNETVTTTNDQYQGSYQDNTSINTYGERDCIQTVSGITSNYLCTKLATGVVTKFKDPQMTGQVKILGTPSARIGDTVYVKIPSLEINGASIDGNYTVTKITHDISAGRFETTLDLGHTIKTPYDYLAQFARETKETNSNGIKFPA